MTLSNIIIAVVVLAAAAYILRHVVGLFKGNERMLQRRMLWRLPVVLRGGEKSSEKQKPAEK